MPLRELHFQKGVLVADMRWKEEREEIIELVYRVQADHGGSLPEREAKRLGPWAPEAIKRARRIRWLVSKGSPPVLSVTNKGAKTLDAALASRGVLGTERFGGSIVHTSHEHGPVLLPQSLGPYMVLKQWALEQGVLKREDIDRIVNSDREAVEEPTGVDRLHEQSFPGVLVYGAAFHRGEGHQLAGIPLDPQGYEGAYQVTIVLTRRGAPDEPSVFVLDAYALEGDSHLILPEQAGESGPEARSASVTYTSPEGEQTVFELAANRQGRLGKIATVLRAESAEDARKTAYRLLNPFLCDLSFRYDVPVEVLQMNVAELSTLTLGGMKQADFHEKVFDPGEFFGTGLSYEAIPNYEFFTRLYREGANSSSADYGFLCFFRIVEGIVELRRRRVAEQEGRPKKAIPKPDVFFEDEVVEVGGSDNPFPEELQGQSMWGAFKRLEDERVKVGHAFLHDEDPVQGHEDVITDRLEGEERAATRRSQARYISRRMLEREFLLLRKSAREPAGR